MVALEGPRSMNERKWTSLDWFWPIDIVMTANQLSELSVWHCMMTFDLPGRP